MNLETIVLYGMIGLVISYLFNARRLLLRLEAHHRDAHMALGSPDAYSVLFSKSPDNWTIQRAFLSYVMFADYRSLDDARTRRIGAYTRASLLGACGLVLIVGIGTWLAR